MNSAETGWLCTLKGLTKFRSLWGLHRCANRASIGAIVAKSTPTPGEFRETSPAAAETSRGESCGSKSLKVKIPTRPAVQSARGARPSIIHAVHTTTRAPPWSIHAKKTTASSLALLRCISTSGGAIRSSTECSPAMTASCSGVCASRGRSSNPRQPGLLTPPKRGSEAIESTHSTLSVSIGSIPVGLSLLCSRRNLNDDRMERAGV